MQNFLKSKKLLFKNAHGLRQRRRGCGKLLNFNIRDCYQFYNNPSVIFAYARWQLPLHWESLSPWRKFHLQTERQTPIYKTLFSNVKFRQNKPLEKIFYICYNTNCQIIILWNFIIPYFWIAIHYFEIKYMFARTPHTFGKRCVLFISNTCVLALLG